MAEMLRRQLLDTSRGRIVTLLRTGGMTADELARKLGVTRSAIRIQIAAMERDGVVRGVGSKPGTTRPSRVFELTPDVEQLLSQAYIPLLTQLVDVFAEAMPADQVEALLRTTGARLANVLLGKRHLTGDLPARAGAVSKMMNLHLGTTTRVERNGRIVIRGAGCPLAALTGKHKSVCLSMESLVAEALGVPVRECCDRDARPRCCFELEG